MNRHQEQRALMLLQCVLFAVVIGALLFWLIWSGVVQDDQPLTNSIEHYQGESSNSKSDGIRQFVSEGASQSAESFPFDPNTADASTLKRLGFSRFQVNNILKYRSKGGQYHRPEDLKRLYGMTVGQWNRLAPYVRIAKEYQYLSDQSDYDAASRTQGNNAGYNSRVNEAPHRSDGSGESPGDSHTSSSNAVYQTSYLGVQHVVKLHSGERIDLAGADTLTLQRVPGVGSYYARRIFEYGKKLGGYVSVDQLNDEALDFLPVGIEQWMTVSSSPVQKLHINKMTIRELTNHPYLTYYQAKQIVQRVRLYGPFHSWDELLFLKEFSEKDKARLEPYVSFD